MAGIRYISDFQSFNGARYRISIWDSEFSGTTGEFCTGPDGFSLSYEGFTDDPWKPFVPSRLEFTFNAEDTDGEAFVIDCATGSPNRFRVVVTESSEFGTGTEALYWQGFVQGEGIELADAYYPIEVKLSAGDIGFFSDLPYASAGEPITGQQTVVNNLLTVLDIAGHLDFYPDGFHTFEPILQTQVNWRGVSMASGGDPLDYSRIDQFTWYSINDEGEYVFKSCKEVVEDICKLFGARFYQSRGLFRLTQMDGLVETTQPVHIYTYDRALSSSGTTNDRYEVDRVDLFKTSGRWGFMPGVKSAEREYKFRRNYMEGLSADQTTPLSAELADIPLLNYVTSSQAQRFTLKFNIVYNIIDIPTVGGGATSLPPDPIPYRYRGWQLRSLAMNFVPMWRLRFYADGATDGYEWHYSQVLSDLPSPDDGKALENVGESTYKRQIGTKKEWSKDPFGDPQEVGRAKWRSDNEFSAGYLHFEIIDEEDYRIPAVEFDDGEWEPEERTVNVELTIPHFASPGTPQGMENFRVEFDIHKVFSRYFQQWYEDADIDDYLKWKVESFELIVHGDTLEEKPETGRKYKVEATGDYRRKVELPSCSIAGCDKRSRHSIQIYNQSGEWQDGQLWYRETDSGGFQLLNHLSVREVVAMNKHGIRLWQGSLIDMGQNAPAFNAIIERGSDSYAIIQGTFVAAPDEWRNVSMLELVRDESGLTYTEIRSETRGGGGGGSLPAGNYSSNSDTGESGGGGYTVPLYEFASGVSGSAYEVTGFGLGPLASADAIGINTQLWLFQDATKLSYPTGYTIDFSTNEIQPTYDFEDSVIELYFWN